MKDATLPDGNLLDGDFNGVAGGNAVLMSAAFTGKTSIKFKERDGDTGLLVLSDAAGTDLTGAFGVLDGLIPQGKKGPAEMRFWIDPSDPPGVAPHGHHHACQEGQRQRGNLGSDRTRRGATSPLLENPDFWLDTLTFGNPATGK